MLGKNNFNIYKYTTNNISYRTDIALMCSSQLKFSFTEKKCVQNLFKMYEVESSPQYYQQL